MTHTTRGIVLRIVKYGESSIIASIYTELFGMQSYLVNGVRTSAKKGAGKANLFQPGAILEVVAYHNELKNLQRLKEYRWGHLYNNIFYDVVKNSIALFIVELLQKSIKQPETNADLFHFIEDALKHLDESQDTVMANFPLYFSIHLMTFFGFQFNNNYSLERSFLDLQEGEFFMDTPSHPHYLQGELSYITSQLLRVMQPSELDQIRLNKEVRRSLLHAYEYHYAFHIQDFGTMKTLPVMQTVLG